MLRYITLYSTVNRRKEEKKEGFYSFHFHTSIDTVPLYCIVVYE